MVLPNGGFGLVTGSDEVSFREHVHSSKRKFDILEVPMEIFLLFYLSLRFKATTV